MELIRQPQDMAAWSAVCRAEERSLGFVPTMGALHEGHLDLVRRARDRHAKVVCSIFVNPLQFNDPADFNNYPVRLAEDEALLREAGCDAAFLPVKEALFEGFTPHAYDLLGLDAHWEGPLRPGHFQGVVNVVHQLFRFVRPDAAYFGEKDRQQLLILQAVAAHRHWPERIVGCPTVRAADGLALSSRNLRLSPQERAQAQAIPRALELLQQEAPITGIAKATASARDHLASQEGITVEYLGVARGDTLEPITDWGDLGSAIALVAVRLGPVRLIDNIALTRSVTASAVGL